METLYEKSNVSSKLQLFADKLWGKNNKDMSLSNYMRAYLSGSQLSRVWSYLLWFSYQEISYQERQQLQIYARLSGSPQAANVLGQLKPESSQDVYRALTGLRVYLLAAQKIRSSQKTLQKLTGFFRQETFIRLMATWLADCLEIKIDKEKSELILNSQELDIIKKDSLYSALEKITQELENFLINYETTLAGGSEIRLQWLEPLLMPLFELILEKEYDRLRHPDKLQLEILIAGRLMLAIKVTDYIALVPSLNEAKILSQQQGHSADSNRLEQEAERLLENLAQNIFSIAKPDTLLNTQKALSSLQSNLDTSFKNRTQKARLYKNASYALSTLTLLIKLTQNVIKPSDKAEAPIEPFMLLNLVAQTLELVYVSGYTLDIYPKMVDQLAELTKKLNDILTLKKQNQDRELVIEHRLALLIEKQAYALLYNFYASGYAADNPDLIPNYLAIPVSMDQLNSFQPTSIQIPGSARLTSYINYLKQELAPLSQLSQQASQMTGFEIQLINLLEVAVYENWKSYSSLTQSKIYQQLLKQLSEYKTGSNSPIPQYLKLLKALMSQANTPLSDSFFKQLTQFLANHNQQMNNLYTQLENKAPTSTAYRFIKDYGHYLESRNPGMEIWYYQPYLYLLNELLPDSDLPLRWLLAPPTQKIEEAFANNRFTLPILLPQLNTTQEFLEKRKSEQPAYLLFFTYQDTLTQIEYLSRLLTTLANTRPKDYKTTLRNGLKLQLENYSQLPSNQEPSDSPELALENKCQRQQIWDRTELLLRLIDFDQFCQTLPDQIMPLRRYDQDQIVAFLQRLHEEVLRTLETHLDLEETPKPHPEALADYSFLAYSYQAENPFYLGFFSKLLEYFQKTQPDALIQFPHDRRIQPKPPEDLEKWKQKIGAPEKQTKTENSVLSTMPNITPHALLKKLHAHKNRPMFILFWSIETKYWLPKEQRDGYLQQLFEQTAATAQLSWPPEALEEFRKHYFLAHNELQNNTILTKEESQGKEEIDRDEDNVNLASSFWSQKNKESNKTIPKDETHEEKYNQAPR